ncbi:MAG: CDP-diacylglycerol--glycerol-3-phosphate 3-phosphatidyltransferase [Alphaproteobacteria bacterium]|nr:CDP-diacylglycerol--glycerol-3-phosphate 3-phosphatidyltransferase [Alphaproteobacteria bacterium]
MPTKNRLKKREVLVKKVTPVLKQAKKSLNIPNLLTLIRIWAIPAIVMTFFIEGAWASWLGVALFIVAGITDYMDGYLARHLNQLSRFGRILDPIADKLLVGSILIMLAWQQRLPEIMVLPAVVILCREILVSGLREFLAEIKVGCPVTRLAKWKTACQMVALPVLMVCDPRVSGCFYRLFTVVGSVALWGAAILTVMTGYDYWKSGRKYMDD